MHKAPQRQGLSRPSAASPALTRALLLATDLQQSILAELDRSGPNRLTYTPYGSQSSTLTAGTHLGFNGQLKEQPTDWYHLGNGYRVYNPVLMRFHSPDRLSPFSKGGLNAYAYCSGDPLNYTDPTGKSILTIVQRGLTLALHSVVPIAMISGPKVSGVALQATRFSLFGSAGAAVGAAMSVAGSPIGQYVSTAGTAALLVGALGRGAVAVKNAYQNNVLWKTVRDNVKNIVGWSDELKVVKPAASAAAITPGTTTTAISPSEAPPRPSDTAAQIRG